ncbi:MAG: UTP--glucose-1-phosphate uridylyltransferase GalU [Actinomycetota bacterium]
MTSVRKAVIPAAGLGTRFLPATKAQPKEMIPVVDKPAIQYVVEEAARSGIDDILIITGRGKRSLEDHFDRSVELEADLRAKGKQEELDQMIRLADLADIHYVRQGEPLGLGHAVSVARKHVGNDPFVVLLGDDIMDDESTVLQEMIEVHERTGSSVISCKEFPPDQISAYGCVAYEPAGERLLRVKSIVEKPEVGQAPSSWAVLGRYVFTPGIFDAIDQVKPGKGGEIQLTDAIGVLLETEEVLGYTFVHGRYDVGNKLDYLRATVELALARPDLGPEFKAWLAGYVRDTGIA